MSERPRDDTQPSFHDSKPSRTPGTVVLALLVPALAVVLPPPAASATHGTHFVDLTGSIRVVDDESWPGSRQGRAFGGEPWPGSDQVETFEVSSYVDLEQPDGWHTLLHQDFCAGDEVRVELLVRVELVPGGLSVHRHATVFEGEDCGRSDRDGVQTLSVPVTWLGTPLHLPDTFTVGTTADGGDHADVALCVEMDDVPWAQDCVVG